jgi:AhpD family alkylhydroperoxidase
VIALEKHAASASSIKQSDNRSRSIFADGALPGKTKQFIAVAVAHVTQGPYCIRSHTKAAIRQGATPRRLWRRSGSPPRCGPGGSYANSAIAPDTIARVQGEKPAQP